MKTYEVELIRLSGFTVDSKPILGWCPLDTFSLDSYMQSDDFGRSKIGKVRYIPAYWGKEFDDAPYTALYIGYRIKSGGEVLKEVIDNNLIKKLREIKFCDSMIGRHDEKLMKLLNLTW